MRNLHFLFVFLLFGLSVARLADSLGKSRHPIGGGEINNNFCALDSNSQCDWGSYSKALITIGLPFLILAVLSLIALPVFLIGRYCFNLFGGTKRNSRTVFVGSKKESFDLQVYQAGNVDPEVKNNTCETYFSGYPRGQILGVQILSFLLLIGFIVCLIVGLVGNSRVHKGLDSSIDQVAGTADDFSNRLSDIVTRVSAIPIDSPIKNVTNQMNNLAVQTRDIGEQIQGAKNSYEPARTAITVVFLILPILVLLLGILGGFFNAPRVTMTAASLSFIVSFILWLMFAAYICVSIISNDACNTARPFVTNLRSLPSAQVPDQPISQFVACSNGATFANYRQLANQTQTQLRSGICTLQNQICSAQSQTCSTNCVQGDYQTTLSQLVNDPSGSFTMQQCPQLCSNSDLKTATSNLVLLVTSSQEFDSVYEEDLLPIIDCSVINTTIDQTLNNICGPTSSGADTVAIIFLILALLNVFVTIVLILAYKRWRKGSLRRPVQVGPPSPSRRSY